MSDNVKVTGTFWVFKQAWSSKAGHADPILYILDNQKRVISAFPVAGSNYEWIFSDKPGVGEFLDTYGYAHEVAKVV